MAPLSFKDELPEKFRKFALQPRPTYSYTYLMKKAAPYQLDTVRVNVVKPLLEFADQSDSLLKVLKRDLAVLSSTEQRLLAEEMYRGLQITSYRARHRAYTLDYLLDKSEAKMRKQLFEDKKDRLAQAIEVRELAEGLVKQQEELYKVTL